MAVSMFVNFPGTCREAVSFYADAFGAKRQPVMEFSEMPPDPEHPIAPEEAGFVMYTFLTIGGSNVMFSDVPASYPYVAGNNISLTVGLTDADEVRRVFARMSEGGRVEMELQETFWSPLYGSLVDRFGIPWQILLEPPQA